MEVKLMNETRKKVEVTIPSGTATVDMISVFSIIWISGEKATFVVLRDDRR
jgi:hypothetical protein